MSLVCPLKFISRLDFFFDTNKISSLSEYAEPLTSYLEGLGDAEKVSSLSLSSRPPPNCE
jgi:hypothetical protein